MSVEKAALQMVASGKQCKSLPLIGNIVPKFGGTYFMQRRSSGEWWESAVDLGPGKNPDKLYCPEVS